MPLSYITTTITLTMTRIHFSLTLLALSFFTWSCQEADMQPESTSTQFAQVLSTPYVGGLEQANSSLNSSSNERVSNWNTTRVLVNGGLLGFGNNAYEQPYLQNNNLVAPAGELLRRLRYQVAWNSSTSTMTATRTTNSGANTIIIQANNNRATVDGQIFTLPVTPILLNGNLMAPARFVAEKGGSSIIEWDQDTQSMQVYFYEELDFGIYFYGSQSNASTDATGCQKYIAGQPNPYFDASKPTIIYTHGWQKDGVKNKGREGFLFNEAGAYENVQNYWKQRGWNVAIFHWVQFADDDWGAMPVDTEKKIYDATSTNIGMRWKRTDGSWGTIGGNPTKNVTQIYADEFEKILAVTASSTEIRLIGNSLGGNLTMSLVRELHLRGKRIPSRITLIDPYWDTDLSASDGIKLPTGFSNTKAIGSYAGKLARDSYSVAIEYFRTSAAGLVGTNDELVKVTAFSHFGVDYTANIATKHTAPVKQYLWSINFSAPKEIYRPNIFVSFTYTGNVAASANTSNARIRQLMVNNKYWNHVRGRNTPTPSDDEYEIRDGLY